MTTETEQEPGARERTWRVRWWLLAAIALVLLAAEVPTILRSIEAHRGSRPAATADDQREVVVRFIWAPRPDAYFTPLPEARASFRTMQSGPELAPATVDWPVPDPFIFAGLGTDQVIRVRPGTPIAVTGTVDRVQVYFVTSTHGDGPPVARVALHDGVGPLPDLHGTYTMVILGRWPPGTAGFTQTIRFGP